MFNLKCLLGIHDPAFQYKLTAPHEDVYKCTRCGKRLFLKEIKTKCDGECKNFGKCDGEVKKVYVFDWGYFNYCETAIKTDRLNGFTIIEDENKEDE